MIDPFKARLEAIVADIELAENFSVIVGRDVVPVYVSSSPIATVGTTFGRYYFQIANWCKDTFTGEMGMQYGSKAYLDPDASDSELIQTVFGLYKGYWEHEARETFKWRKRRVFGPHMDVNAIWEVARRVDLGAGKVK